MTIEPLWSPWWTSPFPPLYIVKKKLLATNPIFSHSFDHIAFKLQHKLLYATSLWIMLLMTIEPLWSDGQDELDHFRQFGLVYSKKKLPYLNVIIANIIAKKYSNNNK